MLEANPTVLTRNLLLWLAYDGTEFSGWQIQPDRPTIQGCLAAALQAACGEAVTVSGAGRTDAGVHASWQAANVRLHCRIPCPNLVHALNDHLPEAIRIVSAQEVPWEFHARYHALSKIYRYRIFRGPICPPGLSRYVYPFPYPLQEEAMQEAARHFRGRQDFRSLASAQGQEEQEESFVRTILRSELARHGEQLVYTVEGNGFLHHMVRNMVGTLLWVGRKRIPPQSIPLLLAARDRSAAGPTAPARGLHLLRVIYPPEILSPEPPWDKPGELLE